MVRVPPSARVVWQYAALHVRVRRLSLRLVHAPDAPDSAQREVQSREEVGREGYVAVATVADEWVELFVKHAR